MNPSCSSERETARNIQVTAYNNFTHKNTGITSQTTASTDLPIEALKLPHAVSLIVNLIPPPQPDQNPAAHILHHPEVKRRKEHGDHKDDDEALHKEREQDVEG